MTPDEIFERSASGDQVAKRAVAKHIEACLEINELFAAYLKTPEDIVMFAAACHGTALAIQAGIAGLPRNLLKGSNMNSLIADLFTHADAALDAAVNSQPSNKKG